MMTDLEFDSATRPNTVLVSVYDACDDSTPGGNWTVEAHWALVSGNKTRTMGHWFSPEFPLPASVDAVPVGGKRNMSRAEAIEKARAVMVALQRAGVPCKGSAVVSDE